MTGKLLLRGMLAGLVAGLLTFAYAKTVGEPQVDLAIAVEQQGETAHAHAHAEAGQHTGSEPEEVSRGTQSGIGLLTGVAIYGAAIGGLFALVFAYAYGRVGNLGPRALSAWLALGAFIAIVVVPNIKYPANPPAVGDAATIGMRTGLFFLMIAISLAALAFALKLRRRAVQRLGSWNGSIAAGAVFIVIVGVAQAALPVVNEVPADFPAALLWNFRLAAIGMQVILWTVIGLLFGALAERQQSRQDQRDRQQKRSHAGQPPAAAPLA